MLVVQAIPGPSHLPALSPLLSNPRATGDQEHWVVEGTDSEAGGRVCGEGHGLR